MILETRLDNVIYKPANPTKVHPEVPPDKMYEGLVEGGTRLAQFLN